MAAEAAPSALPDAKFTRAEVAFQAKEFVASFGVSGRALLIIGRLVLDVSVHLREHPGGEAVLRRALGGDAGPAFFAVGHSAKAARLARELAVGRLADSEGAE